MEFKKGILGRGWHPEEKTPEEKEFDELCINLLKSKLDYIFEIRAKKFREEMKSKL